MDDPQTDHVETASQYADHPGPMVVVKYYGAGNAYLGRLRIPKGASLFEHESKRYFKRAGHEDLFDLAGDVVDEDANTLPLDTPAVANDGKKEPGQVAFEAYGDAVGWTAYDGQAMPQWDDIRDSIKNGWRAAARALGAR
jgi:hypothetical protein